MRKIGFTVFLIIFIGLPIVATIIVDLLSKIIIIDFIMTVAYVILGIIIISFIKDIRKGE